jgi:hypothetical protein
LQWQNLPSGLWQLIKLFGFVTGILNGLAAAAFSSS